MKLAMTALTAIAVAVCPHSSIAEPGPIGQWLMNTPVTLWDRGMDAMNKEASKLRDLNPSDWLPPGMVDPPHAFVSYDWDNNEIILYVSFNTQEIYIDHEWCNIVRRRVISRVTNFPEGVTEQD